MPPKSTGKPVKSTTPSSASKSASRDLVPVGPRHVSTKASGHLAGRASKNQSKRNEHGDKPTTSRAIVLRNGKYGARGTGELMLASKLIGRDKLDLLAEDLVEQSKKAILSPFRLDQSQKIAESQCSAFLDDITNLRDPELFQYLIHAELNARTQRDPKKSDPSRNPSYVASTVSTKIHNAYLLASAWKIVSETLHELAQEGLTDQTIKMQLRRNENLRARYLVLYDMVNLLVNLSQAKFSLLATTTPHYSRYFKPAEGSDPGESEIIFDWAALREACISFLDSIVIELCFPRAPYPKAVLCQILRDAVDESPKEAKRFPQALWDAVGDLSVSIELQQILEAPLLGPEGDAWKNSPRTKIPETYESWMDAQIDSEEAAGKYANFKDIIFPLEKTKNKVVLENMWKYVNLNYKDVSGKDIDSLWELTDALDLSPQWHSYYIPDLKQSLDYDSDNSLGPALFSQGKKKGSKFLAITNGPGNDSDDSMPELQSVSNSSDEVDSDDDDSEDDNKDEDSDDSGYDTEQEDEIRDMLREAMDTAHEADWLHSANVASEIDPFSQEDRKGNPFLRLLGSLRGRMFSSSPKLRTGKEPFKPKPDGTSMPSASSPKTQSAADAAKSYKATVEDVEDEDEAPRTPKKKKKKPKKKKKLTPAEPQQGAPAGESGQAPTAVAAPVPVVRAQSPPAATPKKVAAAPVSPQKAGSIKSAPSTMSTTSLSLGSIETAAAQSARSYLQSENLDSQRTKIKTRPDYATSFTEKAEKKGVFSKIMGRKKATAEDTKSAKHSWFSKLTKKTTGYMHQLLNSPENDTNRIVPMKWDHFLKIMREMGFNYNPSTAGSSVRFNPPDPRDKPITFHRPHPDPTLQPIMVKEFAKRLKRQYGWTGEDFIKQAS